MINKIKNVVIIGAGNVASHLSRALIKKIEIKGIISKNKVSAIKLSTELNCSFINDLSSLPVCDLVLICSNDDSISEIESQIPPHLKVAYTSGSVELNSILNRKNYGVFYPLQTFSKNSELDTSSIPFFIEATNIEFGQQLFELGTTISSQVSYASSIERKKLHISAIFVNNFTNHLAYLAKEYSDKNNLNWQHLIPLIKETTHKIIEASPENSQTGPARRNDQSIIEEHLSMLDGDSKKIYQLLSESIVNTYSKKIKS